MEGTARRLTELFRTVDLSNSFLQFLANYNGHVFVPQGVKVSTPTLSKAVLESSLAQLSIQVEISRWQSQHESLKSEHQSLESEIKEASAPNRRQKEVAQHQQQQLASSSAAPQRHVSSSTHHSSRPSVFISTLNLFYPDLPFAGSSSRRALPPIPPSDRDDSVPCAVRPQHESKNEDRALSARPTELAKSTRRAKIIRRAKSTRRLFVCGICLEEMHDDLIIRPESCGHTFCRDCLRGHVTTRLNERRFPVLCPTCTASKGKGKGVAGGTCRDRMVNAPIVSHMFFIEISQFIALNLGLTDEQYNIWTEMEMAPFSVLVHCRKYVYSFYPLLC